MISICLYYIEFHNHVVMLLYIFFQEKEHMSFLKQKEIQDSRKENKLKRNASIHSDSKYGSLFFFPRYNCNRVFWSSFKCF